MLYLHIEVAKKEIEENFHKEGNSCIRKEIPVTGGKFLSKKGISAT